jgi:hydrogenase nickel incorporation protein HypA/HybF
VHELSIANAVLDTVRRDANGRTVTLVSLRIGRFRQVVPDSLRFYWGIVARDTECEHARLKLVVLDVRLRCSSCGHEWEPRVPIFRCSECASADVTVRTGDELELEYIEVEEATCIGPR